MMMASSWQICLMAALSMIGLASSAGQLYGDVSSVLSPGRFDESVCFQKRYFAEPFASEFRKKCGPSLTDNFCSSVQCLSIETCPDGWILVENTVGRGCCPACVKLLDEDDECDPELSLERCKNGLVCTYTNEKAICTLPEFDPDNQFCLRDYHNRLTVMRHSKKVYLSSLDKTEFLAIPFARDQIKPSCLFNGDYTPKQRTHNKAYCVSKTDGKPTFGVSDSHRSVNQTCKCSESMDEKLTLAVTEFNADTHMKCQQSGNFQQVQCVNETCLCVNEKTGRPVLNYTELIDMEYAAKEAKILYQSVHPKQVITPATVIYGALNRLLCFDEEKHKESKKPIDKAYVEECFQELHRSSYVSTHFAKKGAKLEGLIHTTCGYDDRYYRVQCPDAACTCHGPDGNMLGAYRTDSTRSDTIDCRCALEEYMSNAQVQSFDILRCDGEGNFKAVQCSSNDKICHCTDENGARISERFIADCVNRFIRNKGLNFHMEYMCLMMRNALKYSDGWLRPEQEFNFDSNSKKFSFTTTKPDDNIIRNCDILRNIP